MTLIMFVSVMVLAACSGSSSKPAALALQKAGPTPSVSAKMVCAPEAQTEIASSLGVKALSVSTPTWKDHLYSCTYRYPTGSFTLSVKEMSSDTETVTYFNGLKSSLKEKQPLFGLGQAAFVAVNGDVAVQKNYKVLLVDVAHTPDNLAPNMTRSDVASSVAAVIMSCWAGG